MWYLNTAKKSELWAWYECFSVQGCEKIIAAYKDKIEPAKTGDGDTSNPVRNSSVYWIQPEDEDGRWIYERATEMVNYMNPDYFGFDLDFIESLQFTVYDSSKGQQHYGKHLDLIPSEPNRPRKLSFSILLSDPDTYEGGELKIYDSEEGTPTTKTQGNAILFPSYMLHEVTPVTKGIRYALVGWVHGPTFK